MKRSLAILSLGYFLSRAVFYTVGVRMLGMDHIRYFLQFIDPELLKHDLLASLYYSSFPPLYNLIVGVILKLFGESVAAFVVMHLLVGWASALLLFDLMIGLGIGQRLALAATLLYQILPPAILFENMVFYSNFEALFFLLALWSFHRFVQNPQARWGLVLFGSATALALLNARMMFYFFIIGFFLWWAWRNAGRVRSFARAAFISATPILFVIAVMAKNAWLFGEFTVDPHFGFHMGNGFCFVVWRDPEIRDVCLQDYPILAISPTMFPPADRAGLDAPPKTGVPLLDNQLRSTGLANYNNLYYIEVSHLYSQELARLFSDHPSYYVRFVGRALANYWEPANNYGFLADRNRKALGWYDTAYMVGYPLFLGLYFLGAVHAAMASWRERQGTAAVTWAFLLATIGYSMLAIFVTYNENQRYKFAVEPLLWVLGALAVQHLWGRRHAAISAAPIP